MWLMTAGRLSETVVKAVKEYYPDKEVVGVDMLDSVLSVLEKKDKQFLSNLTCITILDAGLTSLKDWQPVVRIGQRFRNIPVIVFSRYPEMTPDESLLGSNVEVIISSKNGISISNLARTMEEKETQPSSK